MVKILILGVAAVQKDAIVYLKQLGYEVHAIAMKKDGPGADCADYFSEINILDIPNVKKYIQDHEISYVYSVGSDLAMPVVSEVSEDLCLPHFVSKECAKTCNNKDLMRVSLGPEFEGNVPYQVMDHMEPEDLSIEYPFIMKPTDSQGQRGIFLVHSIEEFRDNFEKTKSYSRSGKVICEKYIDGPELSVNCYVIDGVVKYVRPSDRITWPQFTGLIHKHVLPSSLESSIYEDLFPMMQGLATKLEILNGPFYVQIKVMDGKPYIIEVTPRLDGCHMWKLINVYENVNLLAITLKHLISGDVHHVFENDEKKPSELEFICEVPGEEAHYRDYEVQIKESIDSDLYYEEGKVIRPVNGRYEKIGYMINYTKPE